MNEISPKTREELRRIASWQVRCYDAEDERDEAVALLREVLRHIPAHYSDERQVREQIHALLAKHDKGKDDE